MDRGFDVTDIKFGAKLAECQSVSQGVPNRCTCGLPFIANTCQAAAVCIRSPLNCGSAS